MRANRERQKKEEINKEMRKEEEREEGGEREMRGFKKITANNRTEDETEHQEQGWLLSWMRQTGMSG